MSGNKSRINSKQVFCTLLIWSLAIICNLPCLYAQEESAYDDKGKRDPFIPLVTPDGRLLNLDKEEVKGDLSLEGIIYDKHGRSYAIVNSAVVGISDFIGAYQVLKIEENKVIFIKEGQTTEVILKKEE
jgi:hypothetical protein